MAGLSLHRITMESQAKIISIELVPPRAEMEAEEREKGLGTELDASNKGFAMLQKMGYKKGTECSFSCIIDLQCTIS